MSFEKYDELLGHTMASVRAEQYGEEMVFVREDGRTFQFWHCQDCCESVSIDDVCGDLADLVGSPLLEAEEVAGEDMPATDAESETWTFYKFATLKGSVTVRWYGQSNGYYSESVSFKEVT